MTEGAAKAKRSSADRVFHIAALHKRLHPAGHNMVPAVEWNIWDIDANVETRVTG